MDKVADVGSAAGVVQKGILAIVEEVSQLGFVTEANAKEAVMLLASAQKAEESADEVSGRARTYEAYQAALAKKKALVGPLAEATSDLRSRLYAYMVGGGVAEGAHLREKKPTLDIDPEKLPAKYTKRVPDMDRIQRMAEAMGADLAIPGVTVRREWSLVIKGGAE